MRQRRGRRCWGWSDEPRIGRQGPGGLHRRQVGQPQVLGEAGQPGQQAALQDPGGGHGAGRGVGRGGAGRAGLQGGGVHVPRLAPAGPLHRRPGRHQRGQELPQRRRLGVPAVLRHRQGRRLPVPGGQRLPPGPSVAQHHRPVRRPGGALRPGVRRPAGQPVLRRRPGEPHLLRPGPDRPAAAAGRLPGHGRPDRGRRGDPPQPRRRARHRGEGRRDVRDRGPGPAHRRGAGPTAATRWCSPPAATATSTTCPPTP